ncbi:MAG: SDR family NAD(P)-dependent oxidoreductase [Runella sp.]
MSTYFITGAARGIGRCVAETLYGQGHQIIATDIDLEILRQNAHHSDWQEDRVLLAKLDVTKTSQWQQVLEAALQKFGQIDVGMNIAGVIRPAYIADITLQDIDSMIDINLKGLMYGTKFLADIMLRQGGGQIVNVSSLAGVAPIPGLAIYSASKCAVRAFSVAIADELRQQNVFVSVVCPDLVQTQMLIQQLPHPAANLSFSGERILTVEEITKVILTRAVQQKQLEVLYPRNRGFLGKIGNFFPRLSFAIARIMAQKGNKKRQKILSGNID